MKELESDLRAAIMVQGQSLIPVLRDLEDIVSRSIREIRGRPELLTEAHLHELTKLVRFSSQSFADLVRLMDLIANRSAEKVGPGSIIYELNELVEADEKLGLCACCRQPLPIVGEPRAIEEGAPPSEEEHKVGR